ncbi:hypothetical protein ACQKE0_04150 [Shewanella colwelliana]|uniref:hypothetical protein n=1 Tax=Shewanella colwelliana TaxID=23 RepID=UPI003D07E3C1
MDSQRYPYLKASSTISVSCSQAYGCCQALRGAEVSAHQRAAGYWLRRELTLDIPSLEVISHHKGEIVKHFAIIANAIKKTTYC